MRNCLKYDAIHDFPVWLRTASNRGHIEIIFKTSMVKV